jgi:hypothetical protein
MILIGIAITVVLGEGFHYSRYRFWKQALLVLIEGLSLFKSAQISGMLQHLFVD